MRINVDFSGIDAALLSIGGERVNIGNLRTARQILNPIELQIIEQGSIVLTGEELAGALSTTGGLLAIGNTQITLHIYDPFEDEESLLSDPAKKTRFHVTECPKLDEMGKKGRRNRYVSSARNDGLFQARPFDNITKQRGDEVEAKLQPCHYCLAQLNHDGYSSIKNAGERKSARLEFSVSQFFEDHKSIFRCIPLYTPATFPEGNYTKDWASISREYRASEDWVCACCGVDCSSNTGLLHTHHKDGNRGNNRRSNLQALCLACHKAQPFHNDMHYAPSDRMKMENLRISQKKSRLCNMCGI